MPPINAVMIDPLKCQRWPNVASAESEKSHRSSAECLALQNALQTVLHVPYANLHLTLDGDGSLWVVGLDDNALTHWSNGRASTVKLPPGTRVNALVADPSHGVWLGTDRGLLYADGQGGYQLPNLDQYFTFGSPRDLAIDSSGAVWVLTAESRIGWLQPRRSTTLELIPGVNARAIAAATDGAWITHGADLIHLKLRRSDFGVNIPAQSRLQVGPLDDRPRWRRLGYNTLWLRMAIPINNGPLDPPHTQYSRTRYGSR